MRILHVFDHSLPLQSGYSFRSLNILREQHRLGWHTSHLTSGKQGRPNSLLDSVDGLDFHRTALIESGWTRFPAMDQVGIVTALRKRLREVIALEQPDIVQAHSPCLTALAALGLGRPLIYELRSSWEDAAVSNGQTTEGSLRYRLSRALETYVLRRVDAVVTICQGLRDDVVARGIPADRIGIVPNAVDVERFADRAPSTVDMRSQLGLNGKKVLGFAGSFYAWEGLPLLIESLPAILRECPEARVLLVGAGPAEGDIRAAIQQQGMQQHVVFAGQVKQSAVDALYDAIDVLVYPRVSSRLTEMVTPLKPLEAMAISKPFVASDVGGHRELIRHEQTGMLFKAGDPAALAQTVLRVLGDGSLRERLASEGLRFVREERTWHHSVAGYAPVYERVLRSAANKV